MTVAALKVMMEGKNLNFNKPEEASPARVSMPRGEQEEIEVDGRSGEPVELLGGGSSEVETVPRASVRDNAQKLDQFFVQKGKEEPKKEEPPSGNNTGNLQSGNFQPEQSTPQTQGQTGNIQSGQTFFVPEGVQEEGGAAQGRQSLAEAMGGEEGVMARLRQQKRKKMSKRGFSS